MNSAPSLFIQSNLTMKGKESMDELNEGIVQEEEAIIPEGWDGEGDFFDDSSWSEEPVDSTPAEDPTTVEEETVAEEPTEEAPTTEQAEAPTSHKFKFKAKVDHNDMDVELDESDLPDMYQKAQVVDRVQSQMGKMKGTVDRATKLAKGMGFEDADSMLIAAAKNHFQNEVDRLVNDDEHPVNPAVANDLVERQLGYSLKDLEDIEAAAEEEPSQPTQPQTQEQGRDLQAEVKELLDAHPELAGTEFPAEVAERALQTGESLLSVYQQREKSSQAKQIQDLVKENQVLKQNAETAQRAPVTGVTGHGIEGNEPDDDFLAGFNSQDW